MPRPQKIPVLAPMYHVNAFVALHSLLAGDTLVVMTKFDATRAMELIEKHRVTTFTATPTMLQRMADSPGVDDRDLSSVVWFLQDAAPMPTSLVHMIITGGANVFPAEVEMALIDHPKIADVVVIGLRDPEWGRRVHAIIEPKDPAQPPTLDEVRAYAKDRLVAYKVPKSIEVIDAIPRSAATKVNRGRLVEQRGG